MRKGDGERVDKGIVECLDEDSVFDLLFVLSIRGIYIHTYIHT